MSAAYPRSVCPNYNNMLMFVAPGDSDASSSETDEKQINWEEDLRDNTTFITLISFTSYLYIPSFLSRLVNYRDYRG